jgi:hypothetical protein
MSKIILTQELKNNKAVVIIDEQDLPDGYISIAGAFIERKNVEIAIPDKVMKNISLFNRLAKHAQECLVGSMNRKT